MKKQLFAFWRYHQFPYVLGAEVIDIDDDGRVEVKGYGDTRFMPFKIVPADVGEQINSKLKKLKVGEYYAKSQHDKLWKKEVAMILPEAIEIPRGDDT